MAPPPSASAKRHAAHRFPRADHRADHGDPHQGGEDAGVEILGSYVSSPMPGAVDEGGQTPEFPVHGVEQAFDVGRFRDVRLNGNRPAAAGLDFFHERLRGVGAFTVVDGDGISATRRETRGLRADSPRPPRDEKNPFHQSLPRSRNPVSHTVSGRDEGTVSPIGEWPSVLAATRRGRDMPVPDDVPWGGSILANGRSRSCVGCLTGPKGSSRSRSMPSPQAAASRPRHRPGAPPVTGSHSRRAAGASMGTANESANARRSASPVTSASARPAIASSRNGRS